MDVRLSDSTVSSSAIICRGSQLNLGWKNFVNVPPFPGQFTGSDANGEVQFLGWENPQYSLRGVLLQDQTSSLTLTQLKSFAKSTGSTYLYDDILASDGTQVKITTFDVTRNAKDKHDNIYDYSIKLVETL